MKKQIFNGVEVPQKVSPTQVASKKSFALEKLATNIQAPKVNTIVTPLSEASPSNDTIPSILIIPPAPNSSITIPIPISSEMPIHPF